ncbi:MAG TPA: D-alanyl-D-alanine carboxypeptidase [Devosia sp.]|jgi:D-alanyl-D-alanine carboxypeptidase (penicillin-binding protein 5/6)|uniref:D-alanyl-D-alanine carboxypeptidase n=1 Tax=Devosia sp. TaxID=1871048 RepID=UPI002DDCF49F|nr:D-alanyl-D-alanine carboxypeptidase [Devosia sp.]HEV2513850.1 D-alanyl-D-alanine carboxypeptidase [Devosia sp.]
MTRSLLLLILALFVGAIQPLPALAGYAHIIIDANTGQVLSADGADVINRPASLTKMMTLYLVFEALRDGRLAWDERIVMTKNGAATVPTKLGVPAGKTFTVREGVMGMIIHSANDAAEALGDYLAGSEGKFGKLMTKRARQLGMTSTVFRNASGLTDKLQVTTARDLATLAIALMRDFPREYALFSKRSFNFRGRNMRGHNNLMYRYEGMDGIKTGYTDASGFNIASSVKLGGKALIGVVLGGKTAKSRDNRMANLLEAAFPMASGGNPEPIVASVTPVPLPRLHRQDSIAEQIAAAAIEFGDVPTEGAVFGRSSEWVVQIAAADSETAALSLLDLAQRDLAGALLDARPYTEQTGSGPAMLYRARFAGFADRAACRQLQSNHYDCMVVAGGN